MAAMAKRRLACPRCGLAVGWDQTICPACRAETGLWVRRGEDIFGPYTLAQVAEGVRTGRIVDTDEVAVGTGRWFAVRDVELSPPAPTRPAPERLSSATTLRLATRILLAAATLSAAIGAAAWYLSRAQRLRGMCARNLRCIYLAWKAYDLAYGQALAPSPDWPRRLREFLPDTAEWWTCPRTHRPYVLYTSARPEDPLASEDPRAKPIHGKVLAVDRSGRILSLRADRACEFTRVSGFKPASRHEKPAEEKAKGDGPKPAVDG